MNILLTSAGRRSYMVNYFKEVLNGSGKVYVGNSDKNAASFLYADEFVVTPLIYDNDYIDFLLHFCRNNNIKVIIPLFDIDLYVLAKNKKLFESEGIHIIVSDASVIEVCNDKWKTKCYLETNQILTPKTYLSLEDAEEHVKRKEVEFPLVVKPRWGMGSIGIYQAENIEELKVFFVKVKKEILRTYLKYESRFDLENSVLIQEKVSGCEYGVDIINNLDGTYKNTIVKKKYAMRAGETDIAIVVKNEMIENLGRILGEKLRHVGNLDMDLIVAEKNKPYVIDLNARFGGGYPFSHCAGVNLPKAIIGWLKGETVQDDILIPQTNVKGYKEIKIKMQKDK